MKQTLEKREQCRRVIIDAKRACILPSELIQTLPLFICLLQQRLREALTEATDGLGSHRLQKYQEVCTSQTRSQIGCKAQAVP